MSFEAREEVAHFSPTLTARAAIPGFDVQGAAAGAALQSMASGSSRWVCAARFIWETLSHLSCIVTFLRWLFSPLLGETPNPIISAINSVTPSGFCAAAHDGSWCAVCVPAPAAKSSSRSKFAKVSLHWIDSSEDLAITKTSTIEVAAHVDDRIFGAASADGALLLCCGSSGRVSLFAIGSPGESIAHDIPSGPWKCDVSGCAILSSSSKSEMHNFLLVCDTSGRFHFGWSFQQDAGPNKQATRLSWRWSTVKGRSQLSIVHFLSHMSDERFVVGGLSHVNLCGAIEIYELVLDKDAASSNSSIGRPADVVRLHASSKNELPHAMCITACSGPAGILAAFNDGSVVLLSSSSQYSIHRSWTEDQLLSPSRDSSVSGNSPASASSSSPTPAWMQRVVRVGWWTENDMIVIRRNGRCTVHPATTTDRAIRFVCPPLSSSSDPSAASEVEHITFLEGAPSAACFSRSSLKGSAWSVSFESPHSASAAVVHLRASDLSSVYSSLIKKSCSLAALASDGRSKPFSGAREFYLKFHSCCSPNLSLDTLLVAEFVSSNEPLEQRVLLLSCMSSAIVIERAIRLLSCSLSELIHCLERSVLELDLLRADKDVHSALMSTLSWARIFSTEGREAIDFKELMKLSAAPVWVELHELDESRFPRSYRDYVCKRIVCEEVADVALALMICDTPLLFDKYSLIDDILFHFWSFCAASYPEICNRMCVFEDIAVLRNILPTAGGCPLRVYLERRAEALDGDQSNDVLRRPATGFLDEDSVLSWYRRRVRLIESETGSISSVRDLLNVAVSECGLKGLAADLDDASDLYAFLYLAPIHNVSCDDSNLHSFKLYSPAQRLWQLLSSYPLEQVPSAITGVGRDLVDRHNMQYAVFLDCVRHWAFDRCSLSDICSPRRSVTSQVGVKEHYKYDFLYAASALESLNDPSIDVLSWDEAGKEIVDLVVEVCMRSSSDDEELHAVSRLLSLYTSISGFPSASVQQAALDELADVEMVRRAAEVCRVHGVCLVDFVGEYWNLSSLRARRRDSSLFDFICDKIIDEAVRSVDSEISDPHFLRRDLTSVAQFVFGPGCAEAAIGPVFLGALLRLGMWDRAMEHAQSAIFMSSKDVVFRSFHVCASNAILRFENPCRTTLSQRLHDAELCLQIAKDLISSPLLLSNADDESNAIAELNQIIDKQEALHRIASLMEDCGLENVQLQQVSVAYFGNLPQRRDMVNLIIAEAPAIAPSQVMQLLDWFCITESKKDAVDVLSNAIVQAFDAGRTNDAFDLANELRILGHGEALPWAMLCQLAHQAESRDSDIQRNIVSTAVLHAPASEILDERNDRHWHASICDDGETLFGAGANLITLLLCEDFANMNESRQFYRIKCIIIDSVPSIDLSSIAKVSKCLHSVHENRCAAVHPAVLDRALQFILDLQNVLHSAPSLSSSGHIQTLLRGDDDDVCRIVDDIISRDEVVSCSLLAAIFKVIERPEISRTRSECCILNVYKLGLSPALMQEAVCCLSQYLPPWSWRSTLAELTLRQHTVSSSNKGMLKSIVFAAAMSEVDSIPISDIDYSLPHHLEEASDDRVQALASTGGPRAARAASEMQFLLENGLDLSLCEIMSISWQNDSQPRINKAVDAVHMLISPSLQHGLVFKCVKSLLSVMELLGLLPFCEALPQLLWQATALVCTQNHLFSDALLAINQSGDNALKLLLTSQGQDNLGVSASSLILLLFEMRSNAPAATSESHTSVMTRACCAAVSYLTPSNLSTYRMLLSKFGDDSSVCSFIIFALGGELVQVLESTQENEASARSFQMGIERTIRHLPDRSHRAPLDDLQRAVLSLICDALEHAESPSLLSDVIVIVSASLERICDMAREQLAPAISRVARLLSSTSADLSHAFKALVRLLSVDFDQNASIQDPASYLLQLLPLCNSTELVAAVLNVVHAVQGRPAFDATTCDDHFSVVCDANILDIPGSQQFRACWRSVLCHCLKIEQCADMALHAYATSGRLALNADDEDAVYVVAPPSHASAFRCLSLRREVRSSAFASMVVSPFALAALALSSLSRDFLIPDVLPCSDLIIDSLKSTDGCTIALHACATTYAVPFSRSEIARLIACLLLKWRSLHCAALVLSQCECVPVSREFAYGRGGLSILRKSIKEGIENGILMITRSHYRQVKDLVTRDNSI